MLASEVAQHLINGLIAGAIIALPALGLTLIFSVLGFANFALAAHATLGAYAAWWANTAFGWPVAACLAAAFGAAGAAGLATDRLALDRLRRGSGPQVALTLAIVSIALNMILESALRFSFGNDLRSYNLPILRDVRWGASMWLDVGMIRTKQGFCSVQPTCQTPQPTLLQASIRLQTTPNITKKPPKHRHQNC